MTQTLRQVSNPPEIKLTGGTIKISKRPSNGTKASLTFSGDTDLMLHLITSQRLFSLLAIYLEAKFYSQEQT